MHPLDKSELNAGRTLPPSYGQDRLVLLVRDPHWLFSYWELTPALIGTLHEKYGTAWSAERAVLRVYDIDNGTFKDIDIDTSINNWHLNVEDADHNYRLELGRVLPDGRFICALTSNTVRTPRDTISSVLDPRWKMFAFWQHRYFRRMAIGLSSFELFDRGDHLSIKEVNRV